MESAQGLNETHRYENFQAAQFSEWEATCQGCGSCCGIVDGDACEHLVLLPGGRYSCRVYENRLGLHKTLSGKEFRCVPLRDILYKSWPGDRVCGYKGKIRRAGF